MTFQVKLVVLTFVLKSTLENPSPSLVKLISVINMKAKLMQMVAQVVMESVSSSIQVR